MAPLQLKTFGSRSAEYVTFALASLALALVRIVLAWAGLERTQRIFTTDVRRTKNCPAARNDVAVHRISRAVRIASSRMPWAGGCLPRSLVLRWLLQRSGVEATLRIGTRLTEGALSAHAWVEVDGQPLNEPATVATGCSVFEDFSSASPKR